VVPGSDPEQQDEFEAAREELVHRFEATTGSNAGWAVRDVLEYKWQYLDPNLTAWSVDDVRTLLFEIFPAKVEFGPNDAGDFIAGFAAFLRFLSTQCLLSEGTGERLARRVEDARAEFEAAMTDVERFSPGKRLVAEMIADGVDPTDQEAMDRWVARFNERSFEERDRILGPSLEKSRQAVDGGAERTRLLPVVLAPEAEVREAAQAAVISRQVRDLVGFVGSGRKLTDKGNLTLADGKSLVTVLGTADTVEWQDGEARGSVRSSKNLRGVDLVFRLAVAAEFLEMPSERSVRVGPAARLLDSEPLDAASRLLEAALVEVGLVRHDRGDDHYGFGWFAEDLDEGLTRLLLDLYLETEPIAIDEFTEEFWEDLHELYDLDDVEDHKLEMHQGLMEYSARRALHTLVAFGVVEESDIESVRSEWGRTQEVGGTVDLTPLGMWLVHGMLASVADVPVAGLLSAVTADELLTRAADLPGDIARVELEVWVQAHGDEAAALLVEALPEADETGRLIAFGALLDVGPAAAEAMARLAGNPDLSAYALIWRVQTGLARDQELDADGDPELLIRNLYALQALWGPEVMPSWLGTVAGTSDACAAIEETWRVRLPETEAVLATLGSFHPRKDVAKTARTALFKFRSSGGPPE
jgi:hypothetical protein